MRYLVLTDIHGNLEALDACLSDARTRRYTSTLVLGDIVGYGADPNAVVDRVRELNPQAVVRGNHDKVASGIEQPEGFNIVARAAVLWTFETLEADRREWLAALPEGPTVVDSLVEICHGSPVDEDAYILDELDAIRALRASERPVCAFGHTHISFTYVQSTKRGDRLDVTGPSPSPHSQIEIQDDYKYLVNPGAVGQPRDGDPRAAYAIIDTDRKIVELMRVQYPIEAAQAKIVAAGLPDVLAQRLSLGR
jgi:diadenosine tetraphosphatase ApaH/serine/threonine PP2A family protein phosphatase